MNIKSFKDENRFVVIFEDLENMPNEEILIKTFLSNIGQQIAASSKTARNRMVRNEDEKEKLISQLIDHIDDKLVSIKTMADETKVLNELQQETYEIEDDYCRDILNSAIKNYLRQRMLNFSKTNYPDSLSNYQAEKFIVHYGKYINQEELKDMKNVKESVNAVIKILQR